MPDYNQTRSFNLGIAKEVSVEAALIYDDLAYAQETVGQGKWFYRSYERLMARLPFSESTIRRNITKLEKAGWIKKKIMKVDGAPLCHFQIDRSLSVKMTETKESVKMTETSIDKTTINNTKADSGSFGAEAPPFAAAPLISTLAEILGFPNVKPLPTRVQKLKARLKTYTAEELVKAAKAIRADDFMQGKNDSHKKYGTIDYLLRNDEKIEHWLSQSGGDTKSQADLEAEHAENLRRSRERNAELNAV